ncbi:zinc finger CCCH domain-containing protein 37 isoform X2 [Tanacetum coccineum]
MVVFVLGQAVIDTAQGKRGKYMAKCAAIGYGFLPFSFFSFGELQVDSVTLLKRIRKFSMARDIGTHATVHIFNRICFTIAKGVSHNARVASDFSLFSALDNALHHIGAHKMFDEMSSKGKGFEVYDAYVKESIEVGNKIVENVVVETAKADVEVVNDDKVGDDIKVKTSKSVDSKFMVMEVDRFVTDKNISKITPHNDNGSLVRRIKGFYLLGLYVDKGYVEGWEDEDKDLNVFNYDCQVYDLSSKALLGEKEFFVNTTTMVTQRASICSPPQFLKSSNVLNQANTNGSIYILTTNSCLEPEKKDQQNMSWGVGEQIPADISKQGMGGNELVSNDTFVGIADNAELNKWNDIIVLKFDESDDERVTGNGLKSKVAKTSLDIDYLENFLVATSRLLKEWHGHYRAVTCLVLSMDLSRLISGTRDGSIRVWSHLMLFDEERHQRAGHFYELQVKIIWLKILDCHGLSWVIDSLVGSGLRGRNTWRKVPQFSLMIEDKHIFPRADGLVWPVMAGYGRVLAGIAGSARYASTLLIILSAKRVDGSFKVPRPKVSSMMASIDEDVEKSSLTDQDDVGSAVSSSGQIKNRKYRDSSGSKNHVTPSSRSSRSGDHRRSRIGVKVGWFQGDILTLGIIETVQNHHLVTKETTEIMKIKEADMKVQGELLTGRCHEIVCWNNLPRVINWLDLEISGN